MQKRLFLGLITTILALTGCGSVKNQNAIQSMMSDEKEVINLKAEAVDYMINHKFSFAILMYTDQCSYCNTAKENLLKLKKESNYALYQIEMFEAPINYLTNKLPNYFKVDDTYPFMYIIKEGEISYKSSINDITDYANLKKMINSYSTKTNAYHLTDSNAFNDFKKANNSFLLFTYNSFSFNDTENYYKYIFKRSLETNKKVVFVDKYATKSELIVDISNYYSSVFSTITIIESSQKKTTIDYKVASGSEVTDFIESYFSN